MKKFILLFLLPLILSIYLSSCGKKQIEMVDNVEEQLAAGSTTKEEDVTPAGEKERPCYVEVKIHPTAPGGSVTQAGVISGRPTKYKYRVTPPPQGDPNVFPAIDFTLTLMGSGCDCAESNIQWRLEDGSVDGSGKTYGFRIPRGMGAGGSPATVRIDCYCGNVWLFRIELVVSS